MPDLKSAAARLTRYQDFIDGKGDSDPYNSNYDARCVDESRLADLGAKVALSLPDGAELPSGPWRYTATLIVGAGGRDIAKVSPYGELTKQEMAAVAALLIWARDLVSEVAVRKQVEALAREVAEYNDQFETDEA